MKLKIEKNIHLMFVYKMFGFVLAAIALFGFILPFLISYDSDELVILGVIIGLGLVPYGILRLFKTIILYINSIKNLKKQENEN
jgi:hypothetical protein